MSPRKRADAPLRYEWERVILADPDIPPMTKLVALAMATYGDLDGREVRPSSERLVADTGTSSSTVKRALAYLRDEKLIESVGTANRRRGLAEEYHLAIPVDHLERHRLRGPDGTIRGGSGLTQSRETIPDQGSHRAVIGTDQGSHRPRSGVTQTRSGVTQTRIRGHTEPPPHHDQSSDHTRTTTRGEFVDVTTDRARPLNGHPTATRKRTP